MIPHSYFQSIQSIYLFISIDAIKEPVLLLEEPFSQWILKESPFSSYYSRRNPFVPQRSSVLYGTTEEEQILLWHYVAPL